MSAGTSAASARDPVAGELAEAEGGAGGGSGALARWGGVLWVGGVSLATALLRAAAPRWHLANLSMLYLLVILATALLAGRGPAILAALLSFMALDWYFVPPVGHWTVSDPDEWLALLDWQRVDRCRNPSLHRPQILVEHPVPHLPAQA